MLLNLNQYCSHCQVALIYDWPPSDVDDGAGRCLGDQLDTCGVAGTCLLVLVLPMNY